MSNPRTINTFSLIGEEIATEINYTSENREILLRESTPCLRIHTTPFPENERRAHVNKQRIAESLGQLAHYLDQRAPFYKPEYVIGLTHLTVGKIAAKWFHFDLTTDLPLASYPKGVVETVKETYYGTPCMVTMSVEKLLERYNVGEISEETQQAADLANLVGSIAAKVDLAVAAYEKLDFSNLPQSKASNYLDEKTFLHK